VGLHQAVNPVEFRLPECGQVLRAEQVVHSPNAQALQRPVTFVNRSLRLLLSAIGYRIRFVKALDQAINDIEVRHDSPMFRPLRDLLTKFGQFLAIPFQEGHRAPDAGQKPRS